MWRLFEGMQPKTLIECRLTSRYRIQSQPCRYYVDLKYCCSSPFPIPYHWISMIVSMSYRANVDVMHQIQQSISFVSLRLGQWVWLRSVMVHLYLWPFFHFVLVKYRFSLVQHWHLMRLFSNKNE